VNSTSGEIYLYPKKFSERVIDTILADFSTYEGSTAPSLPVVREEVATLTGGNNFITISPKVLVGSLSVEKPLSDCASSIGMRPSK
jgi:hypothetical protein